MESLAEWENFFWAKIYPWLDRLAQRAIPGTTPEIVETREACKDSLLSWLKREGFAKLRASYRQEASPEAFFKTVIRHRLVDCLRQKLGRPRVPLAVKKLGAAQARVYELYYLKRWAVDQIVNAMSCKPYSCSRSETLEILYWLWARYPVEQQPVREDEDKLRESPEKLQVSRVPGEQQEGHLMVAALWSLLADGKPVELPADVPAWLEQFRRNLQLTWEERLVLKMSYLEDLCVTKIAKLLRWPRRKVIAVQERALRKIRQSLEKMGFGSETLAQLYD